MAGMYQEGLMLRHLYDEDFAKRQKANHARAIGRLQHKTHHRIGFMHGDSRDASIHPIAKNVFY